MESYELKSANGASSITFAEREPLDTAKSIDYFTVPLSEAGLLATARVYAFRSGGLPQLFQDIADTWESFTGPHEWSSLEGEFKLVITHDGLGHFWIAAELRAGLYPGDWVVQTSVMVETSQLKRIAFELSEFLGNQA